MRSRRAAFHGASDWTATDIGVGGGGSTKIWVALICGVGKILGDAAIACSETR